MRHTSYRHIDPAVLLKTIGSRRDAFRALSRTFVETAPPLFARLQAAMASGDRKAAAQASHALRGNTSLIGASRLGAMLLEIERSALKSEEATATVDAAELAQMMEQVLLEVGVSIADDELGVAAGGAAHGR